MEQAPAPPIVPERLLLGPGPSNVDPRVVEAMTRPILGYLDPDFVALLDEVVTMLRTVYGQSEGLVFPLSSTGTAGMEAGIAALVEPGDTVVVGVAGYFGSRLVEIARRHGASVVEVTAPLGEPVPTEALLDALARNPRARALAVVHAETSTGVLQPLVELGTALAGTETLFVVDAVTALGGVELRHAAWGLDYAYSCTQKCLGAPPGMSPVALSERAAARMRERAGRLPFVFDFELLAGYWQKRPPSYHHTPPAQLVYALHEALRLILEEGLEARWRRHAEAGETLRAGLAERGLQVLAAAGARLPQLTAVLVPEGVDGKEVQRRLLLEEGVEVGGALGPAFPPIWRIGLMGFNATVENATRALAAFDAVLASAPAGR